MTSNSTPSFGRPLRALVALSVAAVSTVTFSVSAGAVAGSDAPSAKNVASNVTEGSPIAANGVFSPTPGGFVPITPRRLLDTRTTPKLAPWGADGRYLLKVLDPADATIPFDRVGAVALNVTVVDPDDNGYLIVYDASIQFPGTSVLNYTARDVVANSVTVGVGPSATIAYYSPQPVHLIIDITGWYTKQPTKTLPNGRVVPVPAAGGGFMATTPARIFDSRSTGRVKALTPQRVVLPRSVAIPEAGISALVMNVVSTGADSDGFATFYPSRTEAPGTSSLNYAKGVDIANQITVKTAAGNAIDFYTSTSTNLIIDLVGYYTGGATGPGGFVPVQPVRVMDTRSSFGNYGYDALNEAQQLIIGGSAVIPRIANAVSANVVAGGSHDAGFLTVWPDGVARPASSNLNFKAGQVVANGLTIGLGTLKGIEIYASGDPFLIVDVNGYFTSPFVVPANETIQP
jgi:hypothetical protein